MTCSGCGVTFTTGLNCPACGVRRKPLRHDEWGQRVREEQERQKFTPEEQKAAERPGLPEPPKEKVPMLLAILGLLVSGGLLAQVDGVLNPEDIDSILGTLFRAIGSGDWPAAAAVLVVGAVWALRKWAPWPWVRSKLGGLALVVLSSAAVTVVAALLGGVPLTVLLVLKAIGAAAVTAIGLHSAAKNAAQGLGAVPPKG